MKAFSAFFMCPVSHTFPAYNGNVMPRRVSTGDACAPFYGLRKLFFLCGLLRQFARAHERLSPQCPGTPRVKPSGKSRLFSDRGAKLFYGQRFSAETLFSVRGFAGLRGRGRGFPLWWCSILSQGGKAASPASASPWRTPANRCRTRLFSALKSAGFRGVAATTHGFSPGRTYQEFPARLHELMFVQENRERAVTLLWGSEPLFIPF